MPPTRTHPLDQRAACRARNSRIRHCSNNPTRLSIHAQEPRPSTAPEAPPGHSALHSPRARVDRGQTLPSLRTPPRWPTGPSQSTLRIRCDTLHESQAAASVIGARPRPTDNFTPFTQRAHLPYGVAGSTVAHQAPTADAVLVHATPVAQMGKRAYTYTVWVLRHTICEPPVCVTRRRIEKTIPAAAIPSMSARRVTQSACQAVAARVTVPAATLLA
jgi:hypothetical protein